MDLNADLGELTGKDGARSDAELLEVVTTTHIACGGHAGDADTIRRTVAAALAAGVVVGAHPSYRDRDGFGRRELGRSANDIYADVVNQLTLFVAICEREGATLGSVKAHGALYNRMAGDESCALAVAAAVTDCVPGVVLVVLAGSVALEVGREQGLAVVGEGFCDRGYTATGVLAPRSVSGGVLDDPEAVANRAVGLALDGRIESVDGALVAIDCATLCIHGDAPGAPATALAVRRALEAAGVTVEPFVDTPQALRRLR